MTSAVAALILARAAREWDSRSPLYASKSLATHAVGAWFEVLIRSYTLCVFCTIFML